MWGNRVKTRTTESRGVASKDFVAASSVPLLLSILARGDSYGYAIIQAINELSGGELVWADSMLYPVLHRLEKRGLIGSSWGQAESGRKRKYYRLLPAGREELSQLRGSWQRVNDLLVRLADDK